MKFRRAVKSGQSVDDRAVFVQNVMNAVARDGAFDLATVAEINRDARRGADGLPVENVIVSADIRKFARSDKKRRGKISNWRN